MAKAFINDTNLTDIADAIRATLDESRQYLPSEMADAIQSIPIMAQLNRKKYFQSVPAGAASCYATIEKIEGNTVKFNQLVNISRYGSGQEFTLNNSTQEIIFNLSSYANSNKTLPDNIIVNPIVGHIYFVNVIVVQGNFSGGFGIRYGEKTTVYITSGITSNNGIISPISTQNIRINIGTGGLVITTQLKIKINIIDLTDIFKAGNEPTTVADFEAWMAQNIGTLPYYDYNAGELLSVKMSGMQTEDSSQQTLDTLPFDVTTFTGINPNTNTREVMFSSGMKQADREGTVKDTLDLRGDTATVKCGIVDLGDLTWQKYTYNNNYVFHATIEDLMPYNSNVTPKLINYRYPIAAATSLASGTNNTNAGKLMTRATYSTIMINDSSYADTTTFKTAMNGVKLIYELATPITYTDLQDANGNPLNPRYKVEQGGTEQVLPANTSTPTTVAPTLTTTYTKDNN